VTGKKGKKRKGKRERESVFCVVGGGENMGEKKAVTSFNNFAMAACL
jgi:hypothetical protein